jgi:hypothetical protein
VIHKFVPKASHECTLGKIDKESKGKAEQFSFGTIFRTSKFCQSKGKPEQFDAAFGTSLELVSFVRAKESRNSLMQLLEHL